MYLRAVLRAHVNQGLTHNIKSTQQERLKLSIVLTRKSAFF